MQLGGGLNSVRRTAEGGQILYSRIDGPEEVHFRKTVNHATLYIHAMDRRAHKHLQLACANLRTRNANRASTQTQREPMIADC